MVEKRNTRKQQPVPNPEPPLRESSMGLTPSPHPTDQRPKTSPYTSNPVVLHIGPEHREYYVPQKLLQNPGWIASSSSSSCWRDSIYLPDIDESTGHVLVHYLYTGAYQTLDNIETSPVKEVHIEFKRAVLAYITAKTYELAVLEQLAMHKIEQHGVEMSIFDVVDAIDEDFSKLPGNTNWFQDYLNWKAKTAFEADYTTFARDDFFGRISNDALHRILVKCIVELYNGEVSRILNTEKEPIQRISEDYVPAAQDSSVEEAAAEVSVAIEGGAIKDCPIQERPVQECSIEDPSVEEASVKKASIEEPVTAEPKMDMSFGGLSSWTSVWGAKVSWDFDTGPDGLKDKDKVKDDNPCGFSHKKKDSSGFNFDFDAFNAASAETAPVAEEKPAEDDGWGLTFGSKSKKKGKKKKGKKGKRESVLEEPPPPPAEPEPEPEPELAPEKKDDIWDDWGMATSSKKKKGKKGKEEPKVEDPPPPETEPEPEPVVEEKKDDGWDDWGISTTKKNRKGRKGSISAAVPDPPKEEPVVEPPPPPPEPVAVEKQEDDWGNWASTTTSSKKKNNKKRVAEEVPTPPPAITEPEPEKNDGGDWGFSSIWGGGSKKKKKGKGAEPESLPEPEPEPEPELVEDQAPVQEPDGVEEPKVEEEDEWGTPSWGKKKKQKDSKKDTPVEVTEETLSAPVQKLDEDPWGSASFNIRKKAKKGKKGSALAPPPVSTPPSEKINLFDPEPELPAVRTTEAAPAEEEKIKQTEEVDVRVRNGHSYLKAELEDEICPVRAKHLLEGDQWKTCKQCRAILRQVAIELARTGHADEDGYEIVDHVLMK